METSDSGLPLRILLVGSGGREHALAWKLSQSPLVELIVCAPGNGGTATVNKVENDDTPVEDIEHLLMTYRHHKLNFLIPGPEAPLVDGIVNYFCEREPAVRCFGPEKRAAYLEGSKAFSKDFMEYFKIPTAIYRSFSNYEEARAYLTTVEHRVVLKADGLAAGKGVIVPDFTNENWKEVAQNGLRELMHNVSYGGAGDTIVIEEFLEGEEVSILSFCDGKTIRSLPAAQDHKRVFDGDKGPNTGGMGAYAPTPILSKDMMERIEREILQPTIDGMREKGTPFKGLLFTGLMLTDKGPQVLEYNVRFGDPETQAILPLLATDLAEIVVACANGTLDQINLEIHKGYAAAVVLAAPGYPGSYKKNIPMTIAAPDAKDQSEGSNEILAFHAGTAKNSNGSFKTTGGRVIALVGRGDTLQVAVDEAYRGVSTVKFEGMQYRKDIGNRALR